MGDVSELKSQTIFYKKQFCSVHYILLILLKNIALIILETEANLDYYFLVDDLLGSILVVNCRWLRPLKIIYQKSISRRIQKSNPNQLTFTFYNTKQKREVCGKIWHIIYSRRQKFL